MADYFNAQSLNPGTAFKPDGFLGGYIWGEDRQRYNQMAPLQDFMQVMQAQEQQNKMRDYGLNETVRATQREADIAKNRATAGTIGREKEAGVRETELKNEYGQLTLKDRAKKVILENAKMEGEAAGEKMKRGAMLAGLYAEAAKNGPIAMQQVDALATQLGMQNDNVVKAIKADPRAAGVLVQAYAEAMPEYRRAMDERRLANEGSMNVAREHSRSAMAVAKERSTQRNKGYAELLRGAKKDEDVLRLWQIMQTDPDVDPRLLAQAKAAAEQADRNLKARDASRIQPGFPGMPQQTPQSRMPGQVVPEPNVIDFNTLK